MNLARLFPRSLLGQMLLAVALALLVAQTIAAVLLFQAEENRREARLVNALAFQLVSDPQFDFSTRDRGPNRRASRRQFRIERALASPVMRGETRDHEREAALKGVLAEQEIEVGELVVLTRKMAQDPHVSRGLQGQQNFGDDRWNMDGQIVLAGLKRDGETGWRVARVPIVRNGMARVQNVLLQTLVLFVVLVGGLAILLRRITRPLAALTSRVERFAGRPGEGEPLAPSGPDDTRRLINAHNAMESRIASLMDEKDVMLGAIGHDLKTPLAALRVRIENIDDDGERTKLAAIIEDITRTLDDILSLARIGRSSEPLEKTNLAALIASLVEEYEDMGAKVTLGAQERIGLPLRATLVRRAVRNLVDNGLRYGEEVEVSLGQVGDMAVISIADHGPGIPAEGMAAMLRPFTRGEASRNRDTGGAGLGLTLARAIAEQHGGTMSLANRTDSHGRIVGLLAKISLPIGA